MGCGAEGCFGNRGVSTHPWRCGQAKGDSGQGLGTVRAACRVRGVCWFPSRLSRAVSASEAPAGPLWECCQARGSQPSPASLAAPAWLLHPPPPTGMRILVTLLLDTLPMLGNVLLLCFFVFFIFGIVGVQLWAGLLRNRCFLPENFSL